jgi:hypothetical protein
MREGIFFLRTQWEGQLHTCLRRADPSQESWVAVLSWRKLGPWGNLWVCRSRSNCHEAANSDNKLHHGLSLLGRPNGYHATGLEGRNKDSEITSFTKGGALKLLVPAAAAVQHSH